MRENRDNLAWPGLNSYTESESGRFFGRRDEIRELARAIEASEMCTVYGPSGIGKTSLLQAGVFPELRSRKFFPVYVRLSHQSDSASYAAQVVAQMEDSAASLEVSIRETASRIGSESDETLWEWLHRHVFLGSDLNPLCPVIVFDQFEEIFTLGEDAGRNVSGWFTELDDVSSNSIPEAFAAKMAESDVDLGFRIESQDWRIVISLREDFLPRLEEASVDRPSFRQNRIAVRALRREQAMEAVLGPGKGIVSEAVAAAIVDIVGKSKSGSFNGVEPALLSLFCSQLDYWRQKCGQDSITAELLDRNGSNILDGYYAESIGKVSRRTAELIEDRLLTSAGYRDSWAIEDAEREGVSADEWQRLVDDRLLHVDYRGGVRWLEFSHDILTKVAATHKAQRLIDDKTSSLRAFAESQRRRARRLVGILLMSAAAIALTFVAVWFLFYQEYSDCYELYEKLYGRPVGIGRRLTSEQVSHRQFSYRLTRRGLIALFPGKGGWPFSIESSPVFRVDAINGLGLPTKLHTILTYLWRGEDTSNEKDDTASRSVSSEDARGASSRAVVRAKFKNSKQLRQVCSWKFEYDDSCNLSKEIGLDDSDQVVWVMTYLGDRASGAWPKSSLAHFTDESGLPIRMRKGNAEYVRINRDEFGRERLIEYLDERGDHASGPDGAQAMFREFDGENRSVAFGSQNWSGDGYTNILDEVGNTGMRLVISNGWEIYRSFGIDRCPCKLNTPNSGENWGTAYRKDKWGNIVFSASIDENGRPYGSTASNQVVCSMEYDDRGFQRKRTFATANGLGGLYGVDERQRIVQTINDNGDVIREEHLGTNGCHMSKFDGICLVNNEYDEDGHLTKVARSGCDGKPRGDVNNISRSESVYSNGVLRVVREYCEEDGKSLWNVKGLRLAVSFFDDFGNSVEQNFYGKDNLPCRNCDGVERLFKRYDARGLLVEERCCHAGPEMIPMIDVNGVSRIKNDYDAAGVLASATLLDETPKKEIWGITNLACVVRAYDSLGHEISMSFYDSEMKPTVGIFGVAKIGRISDNSGNLLEEWYYDVNGAVKSIKNGIVRRTFEYSGNRRTMEHWWISPESKKYGCWTGAAHFAFGLDDKCRFASQSVYDWNGRLTTNDVGVARSELVLNDEGERVRLDEYALDGGCDVEGVAGARHRAVFFNERNVSTNNVYFAEGDRFLFSEQLEYDENYDKTVKRTYCDAAGNETANDWGVACITYSYFPHSNQLAEKEMRAPMGKDGVLGRKGVHRVVFHYTRQNKVSEEEYDCNGNLYEPPRVPYKGKRLK